MIDPIVKALKDDRIDQEISQRALAAALGTVQSHISELENGTGGEPNLRTLRRWADALGYDLTLTLTKRSSGVV